MTSVAEALRRFAPRFLRRLHGCDSGIAIGKAFSAIMRCRTGQLGGVRRDCMRCGRRHWVGRSCGNRHCPRCGAERTHGWLEKQQSRLLRGVHHFLVTFTVPREIGSVLRARQRAGYEALFQASAESLRDVAAATKSLSGSQPGFFGVLHTWGRDPMVWHPHVHYVVPGGGAVLDANGKPLGWKATPTGFLVHHGTLIRVYKAKLADALRAAGLYDRVPADAWRGDFVVDIRPVDDGRKAIEYLAPYVHRVAIGDQRIVRVDEVSVTYRYKPTKSRVMKERTVGGEEFVKGFAQHILPTGFRKVRYYGWMASNSRTKLEELRMIVWFSLGRVYWLATAHRPQPAARKFPVVRCAACGAAMMVTAITRDPVSPALGEHALAYLDSG